MKVSMKALRVNRGLTQSQVAKMMSINRNTLTNWENGTTFPTAEQLVKLCRIYQCSMADIFIPDTLAKS